MLADDATVSVPLASDGPELGWTVFDAQGRMLQLLVFADGENLNAAEHRILDVFEGDRAALRDPQFAAYDPQVRERAAHRSAGGVPEVLCVFYDQSHKPAPNGTRSVLVTSCMAPECWLVVDDEDQRLIEGHYFPRDCEAQTPQAERFRRFVARRVRNQDPFVFGPFDVPGADTDADADAAAARGEL
jgi:hypothetical protein